MPGIDQPPLSKESDRCDSHEPPPALSPVLGLSALSAALVAPDRHVRRDAATTDATTTTTCDEGRWPAAAQGQPATFNAGARAGDYLWHDAHRLASPVHPPGSRRRVVFTGTIVSNAPLTVTGYKLETGDTLHAQRRQADADLPLRQLRQRSTASTSGPPARRRLWIKGSMAGAKLPVGRIWVGRAGHHPLQNPFVIAALASRPRPVRRAPPLATMRASTDHADPRPGRRRGRPVVRGLDPGARGARWRPAPQQRSS